MMICAYFAFGLINLLIGMILLTALGMVVDIPIDFFMIIHNFIL